MKFKIFSAQGIFIHFKGQNCYFCCENCEIKLKYDFVQMLKSKF